MFPVEGVLGNVIRLTVSDGRLVFDDGRVANKKVPDGRLEGETVIVPIIQFSEHSPVNAVIPLEDL